MSRARQKSTPKPYAVTVGIGDILEKIRMRFVCAYHHTLFCDCKYGGDRIGNSGETGNGCPEMRTAIHVLRQMTEAEYKRISKRDARHNMP